MLLCTDVSQMFFLSVIIPTSGLRLWLEEQQTKSNQDKGIWRGELGDDEELSTPLFLQIFSPTPAFSSEAPMSYLKRPVQATMLILTPMILALPEQLTL